MPLPRPDRTLGACVAAALLVAATSAPGAPDDPEAQLRILRERIDGLRERMRDTAGQRSTLSAELEHAELLIGRLARRLRVLNSELQRQERRLADLETQRETQRERLAHERAALAEQVRAAYAIGRQERLKLLLSQDDPARLSRALTYYDYLNRARAARVQAIRRRLDDLAVTGAEIAQQEAKLRTSHETKTRERAELVAAQTRRRDIMAQLTADLRSQEEQLARMRRDEQALEALLADLAQALDDIPLDAPGRARFETRRGALPWPAKGALAAEFGAPRVGGVRWDGVMIGAAEGREVRAVHHGRVAFADWLRGFGLLLIVDHGDGWMTLYGNNQSLFKEVGDWVDANEPVALVGASGGRERPGVYFGIRHHGKPVNPRKWCRAPRRGGVG